MVPPLLPNLLRPTLPPKPKLLARHPLRLLGGSRRPASLPLGARERRAKLLLLSRLVRISSLLFSYLADSSTESAPVKVETGSDDAMDASSVVGEGSANGSDQAQAGLDDETFA